MIANNTIATPEQPSIYIDVGALLRQTSTDYSSDFFGRSRSEQYTTFAINGQQAS